MKHFYVNDLIQLCRVNTFWTEKDICVCFSHFRRWINYMKISEPSQTLIFCKQKVLPKLLTIYGIIQWSVVSFSSEVVINVDASTLVPPRVATTSLVIGNSKPLGRITAISHTPPSPSRSVIKLWRASRRSRIWRQSYKPSLLIWSHVSKKKGTTERAVSGLAKFVSR